MPEDREQAGADEKEMAGAESEKDVEGHGYTPPQRASDEDTDDPDVEGHSFTPPATTPQQASTE